jgi:hypothetical protein
MKNRIKLAAAAILAALGVLGIFGVLSLQATPTPTMTLRDQSGSGQQVYWGIIGLGATDVANWYYLNPTTRTMVICYKGQTLDTIFQPLSGTTTLTLPATSSGRVYFSLGKKLTSTPFGSAANIVLPNFVGTDPNTGTIYDKVEFTYKPKLPMGFVNTTLVDYMSIPFGVTLTGRQKGVQNAGILTAKRNAIMAQMAGLSPQYAALVVTGTGYPSLTKYIRVVSPISPAANYVANGQGLKFDANKYYGPYIAKIWKQYTKAQWGIDLTAAYNVTLTGQVRGRNMVFVDSRSNTYVIHYPSGFDLLGCGGAGVFTPVTWGAGVYPQIDGIVKRDVAAAMNRAVAQVVGQYCSAPRYVSRPYNEYAKVIHANSLNGLNYAFPYDDVCDGSSGMGDTKPLNISITLLPW